MRKLFSEVGGPVLLFAGAMAAFVGLPWALYSGVLPKLGINAPDSAFERAEGAPIMQKPLREYALADFFSDYEAVRKLRLKAQLELEEAGIDPDEEVSISDLEGILGKAFPFTEAEFQGSYKFSRPGIKHDPPFILQIPCPPLCYEAHFRFVGLGGVAFNDILMKDQTTKLADAYRIIPHEAVHQRAWDEGFVETVAWEVLANQAESGDLVARWKLLSLIEEGLLNMSFEIALKRETLDAWVNMAKSRNATPNISGRMSYINGRDWQTYKKVSLTNAIMAFGGENIAIKPPFEMAVAELLFGTPTGTPTRRIYLDGLHRFGEAIYAYRQEQQKARFISYHYSRAEELRRNGEYGLAEPLFELVASLSQQMPEQTDALKRRALRASYYLAETRARGGDFAGARELLLQMKPEELEQVSANDDKGLMALTGEDPEKFVNSTELFEQQYLDGFRQRYTLDDALNDYSVLRKLRAEAEEELRKAGINPYEPVTQQRTLDEQLAKALPYVWAEFASENPNVRPKITFMDSDEFLSSKAAKEAIGRRLQVVLLRSGSTLELKINPSIPLHDLSEAISYGVTQLQAVASREPYREVHWQLISLETLASRAKDGDLLAKHELLMELEFAAWELSGHIANEAGMQHVWMDAVEEGWSPKSQELMLTAKTGYAQTYEINPYLYVMRMLRGDTAGGFRFNSGRIELDGIASYLPGLTGRLPALPER